jgi:hypothetical protein
MSPPSHEWEGGVLNHCTIEVYDVENGFSDVVTSPICCGIPNSFHPQANHCPPKFVNTAALWHAASSLCTGELSGASPEYRELGPLLLVCPGYSCSTPRRLNRRFQDEVEHPGRGDVSRPLPQCVRKSS